jgi:hypothetical protein
LATIVFSVLLVAQLCQRSMPVLQTASAPAGVGTPANRSLQRQSLQTAG